MDSDNCSGPDESNIFDLNKLIDSELSKIEERFMIKIDQRIIDHMKNEWGDSKFNTSLYALQKQYNELSEQMRCMHCRVTDISLKMEDVDD